MSYDIERVLIHESSFDPAVEAPDLVGLVPKISLRVWASDIGSYEFYEVADGVVTQLTITKDMFAIMLEHHNAK